MDQDLRKLGRLDAADLPAAVQRLRGELRVGAIRLAELELRAYFGDPAARGALPDAPRPAGSSLEDQVRGLAVFGKPTLVRAAIAVARGACDRVVELVPDEARVPQALAAALEWTENPDEPRRVAARLAGEEAYTAGEVLGVACLGPELEEASWCAFAVANAAKAAGELREDAVPEHAVEALRCADDEDSGVAHPRLRRAILNELLTWRGPRV